MGRRYLGAEALIGQEVLYLGAEALIGQEVLYLGAEALIGQEVPWCRGSDWSGGTLVQRLGIMDSEERGLQTPLASRHRGLMRPDPLP